MSNRQLEICCGDIESVMAAVSVGADRIELCSALEAGGITPSYGLIKKAISLRKATRVHVLIRPREGDFVYSPEEVDIMVADIAAARECGAQGVVIGALLPDGSIDMQACRRMMEAAEGMSVNFHRAFDMCAHWRKSLEDIIALGCDRILTSGQANSAVEGIAVLKELRQLAGKRIIITGASGVNPQNAMTLLERAGLDELHASAREKIGSSMTYRNEGVAMGADGADEYSRKVTSQQIVSQLMEIIHK